MLTGVTKFAKVSIFSGLNNPEDLTLTNINSDLMGYTQIELENNFMPSIKNLAQQLQAEREKEDEQINPNAISKIST
jgi:hypothetical protein